MLSNYYHAKLLGAKSSESRLGWNAACSTRPLDAAEDPEFP